MKRAKRKWLVWCVAVASALPGAVAETTSEDLKLTVGKSVVLDYPADVRQISTSDPQVVDAVAVTTREILLHAKSLGTATIVVWAKNGHRTFYNISVEHNIEPLKRLLQETFPGEDIRVQCVKDSVTLVGRVSSKEVADRAAAVALPLAKSVVNNLQVAPPPVERQIVLRVKFAELNRTAGQAFGVNLLSTGAGNTLGRTTTGQFNAATFGNISSGAGGANAAMTLSDALNVFMFRPDLNLAAFIRQLQNQDLLQILAEPNLVTTNGKEASFLVGGEFPVPVVQGGANSGAVTVQFREFGIRLTFLPNLTPHGTIKMFVKPEVSTIDLSNSVSISGVVVPALSTRRMETNVELSPGQSFAIGGLIDDRVSESIQRIPGLASVPVLGALFKSRSERKQKTELVVLVTPEIAAPIEPGAAKPTVEMPKPFLQPFLQGKGSAADSRTATAHGKAKK